MHSSRGHFDTGFGDGGTLTDLDSDGAFLRKAYVWSEEGVNVSMGTTGMISS